MMRLELIIGNRNYSSWSLRPWMVLKHAGASFTEQVVPLFTTGSEAQLSELTPAGLVPVLLIDGKPVWDSLAIGEAVAELYPEAGLVPDDRADRAWMRSVCAEMHSGFSALRGAMPMNCRRVREIPLPIDESVARDVQRIVAIWTQCRDCFAADGPWLFGRYSLADAMFAPVVSRFSSYQVALDGTAADYADTVMSDPPMQLWHESALLEPWIIEDCEIPFRT